MKTPTGTGVRLRGLLALVIAAAAVASVGANQPPGAAGGGPRGSGQDFSRRDRRPAQVEDSERSEAGPGRGGIRGAGLQFVREMMRVRTTVKELEEREAKLADAEVRLAGEDPDDADTALAARELALKRELLVIEKERFVLKMRERAPEAIERLERAGEMLESAGVPPERAVEMRTRMAGVREVLEYAERADSTFEGLRERVAKLPAFRGLPGRGEGQAGAPGGEQDAQGMNRRLGRLEGEADFLRARLADVEGEIRMLREELGLPLESTSGDGAGGMEDFLGPGRDRERFPFDGRTQPPGSPEGREGASGRNLMRPPGAPPSGGPPPR